MKTSLRYILSSLVSFFLLACSTESTQETPIKEIQNEIDFVLLLNKAKPYNKGANTNQGLARKPEMHTIIIECSPPETSSGIVSLNCFTELSEFFTIYNYYQSETCPNIYMVWVDSIEYYNYYEITEPNGTTHHLLRDPFEDEPTEAPINEFYNCFNLN